MPEAERDQKLSAMKRQLYELRGKAQTGKLDKPNQIRLVRRDIARLMTLKNEGRLPKAELPLANQAKGKGRGTKSGKTR